MHKAAFLRTATLHFARRASLLLPALTLGVAGANPCLAAGVAAAPAAAAAATTTPATTTPVTADRVVGIAVGEFRISGVGVLRFGDRFQWQLRTELPIPMTAKDGAWLGSVILESVDQGTKDAFRQRLPEPPASGGPEIGPSCTVLRAGVYAIIRCMRDFLFNTAAGKPPIALWPQFPDRGNPSPDWLAGMPLPWWRPAGWAISTANGGSTADQVPAFLFLDYGWVNYGNAVESSEIDQGPALLDLTTGRIARARAGTALDSPIYDGSAAGEDEPIAMLPDKVIRDDQVAGRRVVTVMTIFDRCVAATCRSDNNPKFQRVEPLTYVFD